jgi:hypothetical protein
MGQLLIFILKYLTGILFSIHDILEIYSGFKLCKQPKAICDYYKVPPISTQQFGRRHTFVF